jgi:hypothetical protein
MRFVGSRASTTNTPQSPPPRPGEEQAVELGQFAAEVGVGIDQATPVERRWVYERLRLDPDNGLQIGARNRFDLEFDAVIPLSDSVSRLKNELTVFPTAVRFLRQHLMSS